MEAVILKTTIAKRRAAEDERDSAERKGWQKQAGVKGVSATPPAGGW